MFNDISKLSQDYYHNDYNYLDFEKEYIKESWKRSKKYNVDFIHAYPRVCTKEEINNEKKASRYIYIHSNEVLNKLSSNFHNSNIGFGLISKNCCLIKLYGDNNFKSICYNKNIKTWSYWREEIIGTNAIAIGINDKIPVCTIGIENYCKFLSNFAIYFSPLIVENGSGDKYFYGGIAIIAPIKEAHPLFESVLTAINREISLHMFWIKRMDILSSITDGYGLLVLDQSEGKNHILSIGDSIYKILNINDRECYYRTLEEYIDPLPYNKEFWSIVNKKLEVTDKIESIMIKGKTINMSITTSTFIENKFHINGIAILFSTMQRINNMISKFSGNSATYEFKDILTNNEDFLDVLKISQSASYTDSNILILGESGVGKDILAQSIHNNSNRKNGPFVVLNCAAFSKELIASELFGYEDGAFTGAKKGGKIGKFELANKGTIFLDEIGDMPLDLQATLLRVIEQQSFMKIGGNSVINVDVRIISATNKNLRELIKQQLFREDLYYRLGVIRLHIPPLRERKEDIMLITNHFINEITKRINKPSFDLSNEVKDFFLKYSWPGNVRELKNLLEGIIQIYDAKQIDLKLIKNYLDIDFNKYDEELQNTQTINVYNKIDKENLIVALKYNDNNRTNTAKYLGISRRTLYRYLQKFQIN